MKERLNDLRNKEVINIFDGTRLGYVFDVGLDTETAAPVSYTHLDVYKRQSRWHP